MSKAAELAALIGSQSAQSNRNFAINGAMQVAQRGTSTASVNSGGIYSCDRWNLFGSSFGAYTVSQSSTSPDGFSNSLKLDCTTADTSPAADDHLGIQMKFEGQDLQQLQKGTSSAKSVVVSFFVRSNKTGTYTLELDDRDNTRSFSKTYTISSADTWEHKTVTFAGDTTGALDDDNAHSFNLSWWLMAGSTFTGGTFTTGWEARTNANRVSSSNVNLSDSTSNELYMTGVQMELGEVATPFEHRLIGDELLRSQRYYYRVGDDNNGGGYHRYAVGSCQGTSSCGITVHAPVKMRTTPTLEQTGTASNYALYEADVVHACSNVPAINSAHSGPSNFNVTFTSASNLASGNAAEAINNNNTTSYLAFAAEL